MKKVLVFGVFDGLHQGHEFFLREAKKLGDFLIVVLARDEAVKILKNRIPKHSVEERIKTLKDSNLADEVLLGDSKIGEWKVLEKVKPDIIALGYDQDRLGQNLREFLKKSSLKIEIKSIGSCEPHLHKSSLVNKNSPG